MVLCGVKGKAESNWEVRKVWASGTLCGAGRGHTVARRAQGRGEERWDFLTGSRGAVMAKGLCGGWGEGKRREGQCVGRGRD